MGVWYPPPPPPPPTHMNMSRVDIIGRFTKQVIGFLRMLLMVVIIFGSQEGWTSISEKSINDYFLTLFLAWYVLPYLLILNFSTRRYKLHFFLWISAKQQKHWYISNNFIKILTLMQYYFFFSFVLVLLQSYLYFGWK